MLTETATCKNCNTTINQPFCGNCGQPMHIKRVDKHYILHEIWHILHFEKGIFYTIKELLTKPGQNIKTFITENRSRLVKPIIFIIVTSLIYTLINGAFHIEKEYVHSHGAQHSATETIFAWVQHHYGYANIIMGLHIAFWLKFFFPKHDYNFFEILILLCFVMGIGMLIFSIFALLQGLMKLNLITIASIAGVLYCTWAIGQFFHPKKASSYIKALASYMLGMLTFYVSLLALGFLIDILQKH
ncbi:Protein of unknown function [Filimonas lacunae]|uniref:DUF3667 domain-containing protein n=1 Tax=Filimonas lacunae TaxID=477680 RepID=A0A173M9P5_9BACT|nr:DUF3667 domain-containing protein [Filimonas lacunae]BAV04255.1 hypothetical protein FLA_0234 [Filimonas lacunae]SIT13511.1 Protein of unknown function [Filimonas lacunae]